MYFIASQTSIICHLFFCSALLRKIQLWIGVWFMIISPECLLFLNCFSRRVPTRGLFLLNSGMYNTGRNPGCTVSHGVVLDGHSAFTSRDGVRGGCSLSFVTLFCHGSPSLLTEDLPLFFETQQWGQLENCLDEQMYFLQSTVLPHAGCLLYFA